MVMKIRCTACGSAKFTFIDCKASLKPFHGACCAYCKKHLAVKDLLPVTRNSPSRPVHPYVKTEIQAIERKFGHPVRCPLY